MRPPDRREMPASTARRLIVRFVLPLWIGTTSGCLTISSQDHYWSPGTDAWMFLCLPELWIYGGTVNEACLVGSAVQGGSSLIIPLLIDLPLCIAADTLLLPLTVYQQITYVPPKKPPEEKESGAGGEAGKSQGLRP